MNDPSTTDLAVLSEEFVQILADSQDVLTDLVGIQQDAVKNLMDPLNALPSFVRGAKRMARSPVRLLKANLDFWQQHMTLWYDTAQRLTGKNIAPLVSSDKGDRRFKAKEWHDHRLFDFFRQSYLITSQWMDRTVSGIEGLSEDDARKIRFHTRQMADALAPSNFVLTNPEVLRETIESKGQNLVRGMQNLRRDLAAGQGRLKIMMSDPDAFELGKNVATTPGKVVFQNDLVQLIQYEPTTDQVYRRPLLIMPPWINKYYILDLQPKNSFVRWAVASGYTVFVASWVNPDTKLSTKTFENYLEEGILASMDAVALATGESELALIGYCIGGTLTGAALAYLAAKGDERVKATTFFAAQMDFSEAGDLKVFIDEKQLNKLDQRMAKTGYLEGDAMSSTFNMLRANDLIWSFFVSNYLLGKQPMEFDLLYWNADATRMPRTLHMYYLREMYLKNSLAKPGGITLKGVPIDLSKVKTPIYLQASKEDHIAPYESVFKAKNLFGGPVKFVMASSGHIAGVINPPSANKYCHWINEEQPNDLDTWLKGAEEHPGSWWEDWAGWLAQYSGDNVPARVPGDGQLEVLEDAPGSYANTKS